MHSNILVVEDDNTLRELTADGLASLPDVVVTSCANADEAIYLLNKGFKASLVFTDIHMPGTLDGLDLAREIWKRWPHLPVVLTSGDAVIAIDTLPANAGFMASLGRLQTL
ncbi:response regulator transcription factor [Pseudomonas putida]|uniref:response regulator transcription factor n=1 Tax=Pseudomonas putida TaxID=303 RepID=UPI001969963F|nr:response regulator [Pseudomonas putida]